MKTPVATEEKNPRLWKKAKKRAAFRKQLITYLVINSSLWLIWLISEHGDRLIDAWPIWCTFGWGIAIIFSYLAAYHNAGALVQKEYLKLQQENRNENFNL